GESAYRPFGGMVTGAAGTGQPPAHGRDLKDAAAPLLSHNRKRSAGHIDDAVEVRIHHRLEPLRAQLLERRNISVASVVHDDIEPPERVHGSLHGGMGGVLVYY